MASAVIPLVQTQNKKDVNHTDRGAWRVLIDINYVHMIFVAAMFATKFQCALTCMHAIRWGIKHEETAKQQHTVQMQQTLLGL